MKKIIPKLTRRTTIALLAVAAIATVASASILANYIVQQNSFRVTSGPGLTVYSVNPDGTQGSAITAIQWGDIQQPSPAAPNGISQSYQVILRNTGAFGQLYIVDSGTCRTDTPSICSTVSFFQVQGGLPQGIHLDSNWDQLSLTSTCTTNGGTITWSHCGIIGPGSGAPAITLTLSADTTATPTQTSQNFVLEFDGWGSPTG